MTDNISMEEVSKPVKEIPVIQDEGFFQHTTGDTYDGFFEAKKKDRIARMHGRGTYKTAEGDVYTGVWDNDKLGANAQVTIAFADTSTYEGPIKDWCFSGQGKYHYPDESTLMGEFNENCPVGKLTLVDPNEHVWLGNASQGFGWFKPVNHFYSVATTRETTKPRQKGSESAITHLDTTSGF